MAKQKSMYFINDVSAILQFVENKSPSMCQYIQSNSGSQFFLFHKYITHSDLISQGKRNEKQGFDKNFLYYLTPTENKALDKEQSTAHQSCITCSAEFYKAFNIPTHANEQMTLINKYADVFVANDTLRYFDSTYTKQVISALGREVPNWVNAENDISLNNEAFTPIQVTRAAHGLGTERDVEFHKLRKSIFKNDMFTLIVENKTNIKPKIFVVLEKNPVFFTIIKVTNTAWQKYAEKEQAKIEAGLRKQIVTEEDIKTRAQQSPWKIKLAEEIMTYTTNDGEVFCPFTYIRGQFENLQPLFIASHIKRFEDCKTPQEAWDINNGLLLCANADALFDKHLITVSENKELLFSFLINNDMVLKQQLLLLQPIFKVILNAERMKYLKEHREMFFAKEQKRKGG